MSEVPRKKSRTPPNEKVAIQLLEKAGTCMTLPLQTVA
jgi:hypothetical protein